MPRPTPYLRAATKAHEQLLRGFDLAWRNSGKVPLGHHVLDPRTMENRQMTNMALMTTPEGMTSGLPETSRKMYQSVPKKLRMPEGEGQTDKNKQAGVVVDPTAHETFTGADNVSVDTTGGYGLVPGGWPQNG